MASSKKNKRAGLSDKIRSKKGNNKVNKPLNPFEVHINKEKFKILGKKSKNDKGLPGVSRAKALKKRKETLGIEYKLMNKSNAFVDKRIGEKTGSLNEEDKALARFAAERIKQHKSKQSIFNLAEDEILTHRGQTLEEIEKFDDPRSDDEDDVENQKYGGLQDDFVSEGHFGGGLLSKTNKDGAKSRKDLIDQLIAESKKRKAEKQKQRESTLDLTQKLDSEWQDLQPFVAKRTDDTSAIDSLLKDVEDKNAQYDKTMRELKFEARGMPSNRLKSESEIAKNEKETLEKLEESRLARMHGVADEDDGIAPTKKHRSADDLDDGFELDAEPDFMVAYDADGKLLKPEHFQGSKKNLNNLDDDADDKLSEANTDENDDKSDSEGAVSDNGSDGDTDDSFDDLKQDTSDGDSTGEDDDADLKSKFDSRSRKDSSLINDDTENNVESVTINEKLVTTGIRVKTSIGSVSISDKRVDDIRKSKSDKKKIRNESFSDDSSSCVDKAKETLENRINTDLLARKSIMERAAKELPHTFKMPDSYEELQKLLNEKSPEHQHVTLERLIKRSRPSAADADKQAPSVLFAHLMRHVSDVFTESAGDPERVLRSFRTFDRICPDVYDLARADPGGASRALLEVIKEKYADYKRDVKRIPGLDTLIFFKVASLLFPTSDYRHPVITPCFLFMERILTKCRMRNRIDVSRGLFLVSMVLEYTVLSKRILTSAVTFLRGILYMCVFTSILNSPVNKLPFKFSESASNLLVLSDDCSEVQVDKERLLLKDLTSKSCDNDFKSRTLISCVRMLKEFFDNCNGMTGQTLIFSPHIQLMDRLDLDVYPKSIAKEVAKTKQSMESFLADKLLEPLRPQQKRPKLLKQYEPLVEEGFTGKIRSRVSKEKAEHDKLVHKLKKETKGALREIRRDKAYIGSLKLKQKLQSDQVRKAKVQQIYKEAAMQQGELNKLDRKKK